MPATVSNRHVTVAERPGVLAKTFWELAGEVPDASDPVAVARCAARALAALERTDHAPHVTAATLTFLLRLDTDRIYAAPEQTRGGKTNQRSLVFTVGVLVFEKLTGQHPFGVTVPRAATDDSVGETIPPELRVALDTAMAPFPTDRWSSLRSLRNELERIVDRERSLVVDMPRRRRRSTPPPCPGSAVRRFARGSRPAPIPTAPDRADTVDQTETQATPSAAAQSSEPPMVDLALLETRPWQTAARSLVLMSIGAGLALTAVWLAQHPAAAVGTEPVAVRASAEAAPVDLPEIVVELSAADAEAAIAADVTADDPAIADAVEVAEADEVAPALAEGAAAAVEEASPAVQSDVFDPELAGAAALAAMRDCFSESSLGHGVEVSASLRFSRDDGLSTRVYYAPAQKLDSEERACVSERLIGLSAGVAPERNTIVSFTFWLSSERSRFWAQAPR